MGGWVDGHFLDRTPSWAFRALLLHPRPVPELSGVSATGRGRKGRAAVQCQSPDGAGPGAWSWSIGWGPACVAQVNASRATAEDLEGDPAAAVGAAKGKLVRGSVRALLPACLLLLPFHCCLGWGPFPPVLQGRCNEQACLLLLRTTNSGGERGPPPCLMLCVLCPLRMLCPAGQRHDEEAPGGGRGPRDHRAQAQHGGELMAHAAAGMNVCGGVHAEVSHPPSLFWIGCQGEGCLYGLGGAPCRGCSRAGRGAIRGAA